MGRPRNRFDFSRAVNYNPEWNGTFWAGKFLERKMNLIAEIADGITQGWTHAKIAVEVELKHGVQVGEAWVARITGADGFASALEDARARLSAVGGSAAAVAGDVEQEVGKVVGEGEAEVSALEAEAAGAEATLVGEAKTLAGSAEGTVAADLGAAEAEVKKAE